VYSQFIAWYGQFFGANGLINVNTTTILDGTTKLIELELETPIGNDVFAFEEPSVDSLMTQFESIAEWVSTKFGGVILQNSCTLCASLNGTVVVPVIVPVVNSTNSTNVTSTTNVTTITNSTIVNATNVTLPVNTTNITIVTNTTSNATVPVVFTSENFTLPENCTFTNVTNSTTVQCNDGAQSGAFTLEELNIIMATNVTAVCEKLENVEESCGGVTACF
jgi:hypothetical protein